MQEGRKYVAVLGGAVARHCHALIGAAIAAATLTVFGPALVVAVADRTLGPPPIDAGNAGSTVIVDRDGRLLRAYTTPDGRWRLPADIADVHPRYLSLLLSFEDRRFYAHRGVDLVAFLRSGRQFLTTGRIISGGSTLTMQVARLLEGRHERTGLGKLRQMVRAWQLEARLSKDEILRLYLKLAPMGGNLEGVRAASLGYFGKEPLRLSAGEAALLVALPQSPGTRRPDQFPDSARRARDRVLRSAVAAGVLTEAEARHAESEPVPRARRDFPQVAAHLSDAERSGRPEGVVHRLTIDRDTQRALEKLAAERATTAGPRMSVALLVVDHVTGEVIAHVGSPGYLDGARFGAIDMVRAVRSPGSTLKPFIYGLAFENGLAHPDTLIEDRPSRFGTYAPKNFDESFHGIVSIREALQLSLNIPAVKALQAVGPNRLLARLKDAGGSFRLPDAAEPSLAVALGGVGLSLEDLTALYAGLARGGTPVALRHRPPGASAEQPARQRLLAPVPAWYVIDILRGTPPPANTKGGAIAYKTGTSYGYRDAWAAGFDGRHTIAVWVGRPDGVSTPGLSGRTFAAPILFDAFTRVAERRTPFAPAPDGILAAGHVLPPPMRLFRTDAVAATAGPYQDQPLAIAFPPDAAEIELAAAASGHPRPIVLKADGGVLPLTWLVNGAPIASASHRREALFAPDGRGYVKLAVVDAEGRVDRVTVNLR